MTQPRPTAEELIDAVRAFLEDDLLPGLEGRQRFHTRVAVNVLGIVGRELRDGAATGEAERARLHDLLDADDASLDELSRRLALAIRDGSVSIEDGALLDHLRLTSDADVSIANPRHAGD
jgi:Domain of unknown function (DUF6285)